MPTTRNQVRKPSDRELTEDQLNQITGGTVPSIPIPPPSQCRAQQLGSFGR
jgi:bacteriocin-like protein